MKINSISKDKLVYDLLKKGMDASALRSRAISTNISNMNTKDYKRKYVTFEENLKNSMGNYELKTNDEKHIKLNNECGAAELKTDYDSSMRKDGNNVDIDNEVVNQAANTLMYNALVTQANSRLSLERYVINGK